MTFHVPDWTRSDPGAPPRLPVPAGSAGQVVALVATDGAVSGGWAATVALELARGWGGTGARVVLADGGLQAPSLHLALNEAEGEGMVDALRWGVSVRRVARRPEGCSFFVITAGTPVADGAAVLEDPRWPALCTGFREAGVTLAVLVSARDACLQAILEQAVTVIVIAAPGESIPLSLRVGKSPVVAVVGREEPPPAGSPGAQLPAPAAAEGAGEPELASGMEDLPPALQDLTLSRDVAFWEESGPGPAEPAPVIPQARPEPAEPPPPVPSPAIEEAPLAVVPVPEPEAPAPAPLPTVPVPLPEPVEPPAPIPSPVIEEEPLPDLPALEPEVPEPPTLPTVPVPEPEPVEALPEPELYGDPVPTFEEIVEESETSVPSRRMDRRTLVGLVILLLVVLGAVAAALLGYLRIPGLSGDDSAPAATSGDAVAQGAALAAPPATEASDPAAFSVGIAAFQEEATALDMARDLSGRVPGVLFTTAPVNVAGQVLHRVLAGPAIDSAAALALGARIAELSGLDGGAWVPRRTPRAFQLGEMPDEGAALRRTEVLQGLGVPAYVLAVTYSDGSVRFRVYAGAYADEAEATYLSGVLQERGLSGATLSDRTGRLPE